MSVRPLVPNIAMLCLVVIAATNLRAQADVSLEVLKPTGINGCMTSGCHGASTASDAPVWQRAGKMWFDLDPHAQAYTSLLTKSSQKIVAKLTNQIHTINSVEYRQFLEAKCISCHASEQAPITQRTLGVDCQSCHGPANAWDETHYSSQWQSLGPNRFDDTRMIDVESISPRAAICSSCHVGELNRNGHDREVDHQLMAAGHPPMHFDFELFSQRYPKHWEENKQRDNEVQSSSFRRWQIGKLQASIARLKLLFARADSHKASRTARDWPELTEYSCFSCHHELQSVNWRPTRGSTFSLVWDSWLTSQLDIAVSEQSLPALKNCVAELKSSMERTTPNDSIVQAKTMNLLGLLEKELESISSTEYGSDSRQKPLKSQLARVLRNERDLLDWESAAQWYVASSCLVDDLQIESGYKPIAPIDQDRFFGQTRTWSRFDNTKSVIRHSCSFFHPKMFIDYSDDLAKQLMSQP